MTPGKPSKQHHEGRTVCRERHPTGLNLSHINEKKLLRKMDLHLMPMLTLLYLFSFLDRGNIGNARIEGMEDDLHLGGTQYNWALMVFFFTYTVFELPSNLILQKVRPSIWIPSLMVAWGIVMTLMGIVTNYKGLLIARAFLGAAEAGIYPGVTYYITMWYSRHEAQFRQALCFSAASIAGAFSGLLAFAIGKMNGIGGFSGWRWIFIIEGLATVLVAVMAYFVLYDYPDTASFLTRDERAWVLRRLRLQFSNNGNVVPETVVFKWKYVWDAAKDWQVYMAILIYFSAVCPLYGISFFLPTIIRDLGYTSSTAQLLTVPPYITAAIAAILAAWFADRNGERSPLLLFHIGCIVAGFFVCLAGSQRWVPGLVYFGVFLAILGIYPAIPALITWLSSNLAAEHKRAAGMAIHIGLGNFAGAMASHFYRTRDAPQYVLGHALELAFGIMGVVAIVITRFTYVHINRERVDKLVELRPQYSLEELGEMGDKSPTFRYML
ncbi:MFS general substrate transporter [Aspergillus ibericus CBS 121593]|uniref:MFS general substrate transporter n=1 Tax=Aspergillus ibericus CBS 121593 TaxID=1448316 RepID=A0A395GX76_9EURO|nr:MFS general substrate transporter [Aspergillus ibericus CBS 121593]RAL00136.1 MFS general substrate transporter [Aspergillus ibericus CBS 121593]